MLRVLTLATLFPNRLQPTLGVFVERQTAALAREQGVSVEVVAPVGIAPWPIRLHPHYGRLTALPAEELWNGLRVHRPRFRVLPRIGQAKSAEALAAALLPMLSELRRRYPFDVIDAEYFWPDGPAAVALGRAFCVPVSIKARGSDIHYWGRRPGIGRQVAAAGQQADGLLAVSAALKAQMGALDMPADNIKVHYTGVETERFQPLDRGSAKARLGISGPLVATVGALIERKRPDLAIAAMERVPDATLILVGDGPERSRLEKLTRPFAGRVKFLGSRPHSDLPRLIGAADILLHPARAEGLANAWVEALACGTPVVAAAIPGAEEAISTAAAGRLVAAEPDALAGAIREILAHPPDPAEVRKAAARFTWNRNAAELHAHLAGLVSKAAATQPRSNGARF